MVFMALASAPRHWRIRWIPLVLLTLGAACKPSGGGDTDTGDTDTGEPPEKLQPGFVVECRPDLSGDQLVCMSDMAWGCPLPQAEYYIREAVCAHLWGGTPADYDGKPIMKKGQYEGYIDCADHPNPNAPIEDDPMTEEDEYLPEIRNGWAWGGSDCTDCNVCGMQAAGWIEDLGPPDAWDEIPWCPGRAYDPQIGPYLDQDALNAYCNGQTSPTTGEDPTGGPPGTGIWACVGSMEICGTMTENCVFPSETVVCMAPGGLPDCVEADETSAKSECQKLCNTKNTNQINMQTDCSIWDPQYNCSLDKFVPYEVMDPLTECSNGGPMSPLDQVPFTVMGELAISDGTAFSNNLSGLMELSVGPCPKGICDVLLTDLSATASAVHGVYTIEDGQGTPTLVPFVISDLEIRLLQPVLGEVNKQTKGKDKVVTFPGEDLFVTISAGPTTLDGMPLSAGVDREVFVIEDIQGTMYDHKLTLDLHWETEFMSAWIQITAD